LPENSDWISCSGCENSRSSGEKPNFDPKPQKTRNDSSYQFGLVVRGAKTVVVRGKNRILTRNRKKPEMTVPISFLMTYAFRLTLENHQQVLFSVSLLLKLKYKETGTTVS